MFNVDVINSASLYNEENPLYFLTEYVPFVFLATPDLTAIFKTLYIQNCEQNSKKNDKLSEAQH